MTTHQHARQLITALAALELPPNVHIRRWEKDDFAAIQLLSTVEGWPTPSRRAEEALIAWQHSWPALVITEQTEVVGFVRGLTDGEVTTYIAELLVAAQHRGNGYGRLLLEACHLLYPHTRLDLTSTESAISFYKKKIGISRCWPRVAQELSISDSRRNQRNSLRASAMFIRHLDSFYHLLAMIS